MNAADFRRIALSLEGAVAQQLAGVGDQVLWKLLLLVCFEQPLGQ